MKRIVTIFIYLILAMAVYSLVPVATLYLRPDPVPCTNADAIDKLKNNTGDLFEFIVFGDNHAGLVFDDSTALKLVKNINREGRFRKAPVDFVAVLGDATFKGSAWDYRIFNRIRSLIKWPVVTALGNHDDDHGGAARFEKYAGKTSFTFVDRNSFFIAIDNNPNDLTEEQFSALEEDLRKASVYKHIFVIAHKAPLSPYQESWYRPETCPWSYRFMKLCEKYRVDIVFSGHEHIFRKGTFGQVKYITSGGGGIPSHYPTRDGGYPHYVVVRVYGDYVDYEVRKIFPPFWEFLAYYIWKDIFYSLKDVFL